jgi:hypothetical protein
MRHLDTLMKKQRQAGGIIIKKGKSFTEAEKELESLTAYS